MHNNTYQRNPIRKWLHLFILKFLKCSMNNSVCTWQHCILDYSILHNNTAFIHICIRTPCYLYSLLIFYISFILYTVLLFVRRHCFQSFSLVKLTQLFHIDNNTSNLIFEFEWKPKLHYFITNNINLSAYCNNVCTGVNSRLLWNYPIPISLISCSLTTEIHG